MIPLPWDYKELDTAERLTLSLFTFHLYEVRGTFPISVNYVIIQPVA